MLQDDAFPSAPIINCELNYYEGTVEDPTPEIVVY